MTEILSHELSHVYDVRKLLLDLRDCENLAYSEVRAARIAECRTSGRNGNGNGGGGRGQHIGGDGGEASAGIGFGGLRSWYLPSYYSNSNNNHTSGMHQQRSCVRQKAVTATLNLFPGQARSCLNAVFDAAMADHRPILPPPTTSSSNQANAAPSAPSLFRAAPTKPTDCSLDAPSVRRQASSPRGASPPSSHR
jgi:Peptidase M76 family